MDYKEAWEELKDDLNDNKEQCEEYILEKSLELYEVGERDNVADVAASANRMETYNNVLDRMNRLEIKIESE